MYCSYAPSNSNSGSHTVILSDEAQCVYSVSSIFCMPGLFFLQHTVHSSHRDVSDERENDDQRWVKYSQAFPHKGELFGHELNPL